MDAAQQVEELAALVVDAALVAGVDHVGRSNAHNDSHI
jgi:hypothetical protein